MFGSGMVGRIGIGGKLFIAFLCISALSLSSGVAGWMILRQISSAQSQVNTQSLPAVGATQGTVELTARLVAMAPALASARTRQELIVEQAKLASLSQEIKRSLEDVRGLSLEKQQVDLFASSVEEMLVNLNRQVDLVRRRLELEKAFEARADRVASAIQSIFDLAESLVSNASVGAAAVTANLYDLVGEPDRKEEAHAAIDRLIEHDIFLLERMYELRHRSAQINLLINRLQRASTTADINEISSLYQDSLTVVRRRVASIDDPVRSEQAKLLLHEMEISMGDTPVSGTIFGHRKDLVDLREALDTLAKANSDLAVKLNEVVRTILGEASASAKLTADHADSAVQVGLYVLVATMFIAIVGSGAIAWFYVQKNLVRRLRNLARALQRLNDGDLSVSVRESGDDELRTMAIAVNRFRDESLRRLELEQDRERINAEIRRHREDLQQLVEEQTEQIRLANTLLLREVEEHEVARQRAEQASSAKSAFLATMSHEIRTPMTGMLGMVRLLADSELNPTQHHHLTILANSGEALLGILNAILDYSKVDSGTVEAVPTQFALTPLVQGIVDLMQPTANEKNLDLTLQIDPGLSDHFYADDGKIRQIVFNLVSNAIKFTETGSVDVKLSCHEVEGDHQTVTISVADSGIGIEPAHHDSVFEPFVQVDDAITRYFGGTGLGLAISRQLAELINGELSLSSELGTGSIFTLTMRLKLGSASDPTILSAKPRSARSSAPQNILIVEDDEATRFVARELLIKEGHRVVAVETGYLALTAIKDFTPDLVVMDISLPGMDGIESARRLRAELETPDLPIIAMSAHVFADDIEKHLRSGMTAFVPKPVIGNSLIETIDHLADQLAQDRPEPVRHEKSESVFDLTAYQQDIEVLGFAAVRNLQKIAQETLPPRFKEMRDALARDERQRLKDFAHATRSAAGSIGFLSLLRASEILQDEALHASEDNLRSLIESCEEAFAEGVEQWEVLAAQNTA